MVFVFIPPGKEQRKASPREVVQGSLIAAFCVLAFAFVAVSAGPKTGNPPAPFLKWVIAGLAGILAIVAFFTWLRHQGEDTHASDESPTDSHSQEKN